MFVNQSTFIKHDEDKLLKSNSQIYNTSIINIEIPFIYLSLVREESR